MIKFLKYYIETASIWILNAFFMLYPFDFKFGPFEGPFLIHIAYSISYSSIIQSVCLYLIDRKYDPGERYLSFPQVMVFGFVYNLLAGIILLILHSMLRAEWLAFVLAAPIAAFIEFFFLIGWPRIFRRFYPDHFINSRFE